MNDTQRHGLPFTSTNSSLDGKRFPRWLVGVCIILLLAVLGSGAFIYYRYSNQSQEQGPPKIDIAALRQMNPEELYKSVTGETPSFVDTLDGSNPGAWDLYEQDGGGCVFKDKALHAIVPPQTLATFCYLRNEFLTNFAFQVQMKVGSASAIQQVRIGGIIFRAHLIQQEGYTFNINASSIGNFVDTKTQLTLSVPNKNPVLFFSQSDATLNDLMSPKVLTLIALQDKISVYINGKPFPVVSDSTFQRGQIGIYASSDPDVTFEALFQNAKLWII